MDRIIKITGTGKISVKPDLVLLRFPMYEIEIEFQESIDYLNDSVSRLREIIHEVGLDKNLLKTTDFSISRKTEWNKKTEKYDFIGYKASHETILEIPFKKELLNEVITQISRSLTGIDFSIQFTVKEVEEHNKALLENAVLNARKNAEIIADASNVTLKEIVNIDHSFSEVRLESSDYYEESFSMDTSPNLPDLNPEDLNSAKSVTITWSIE